jgi:hypothetical protein
VQKDNVRAPAGAARRPRVWGIVVPFLHCGPCGTYQRIWGVGLAPNLVERTWSWRLLPGSCHNAPSQTYPPLFTFARDTPRSGTHERPAPPRR